MTVEASARPRWPDRVPGWRPLAPTLLAALLAAVYVAWSPRSADLAAQLFRVHLYAVEGFALWSNQWYGGHYLLGYSVLFPVLASLATPELVAALAAVATAAAAHALFREGFGERSWPAAMWLGAGTATSLLCGRLTFALGLLGAVLAALALSRRHPALGMIAAALAALASPVAGVFAALAGGAAVLSGRPRPRAALAGAGVIAASLLPVVALAVVFPYSGDEPFALSALWPILALGGAILLASRVARSPGVPALRAAVGLYLIGCLAAYLIPTPLGGNATRLGQLLAGPVVLLVWPSRAPRWLLALAVVALAYLQWQAAVRDVLLAQPSPTTGSAFYRPLLRFLGREPDPPYRIEIPLSATHWEAYEVAERIALARGWERQLDIGDNSLFYDGRLTAGRYDAWLHHMAIRYVALPLVALDPSARREAAILRSDPRFLTPVFRSARWRVWAVRDPTPLASGAVTAVHLSPQSVQLRATRAGAALVRVRYTPYWRLDGLAGCVEPDGDFTGLRVRGAGRGRLLIAFALDRIGQRSPRCTP